jgi:alpha-N-arabinofuranosidase
MLLTPTYHAYKMYVPFQDATSLPVALKDNRDLHAGRDHGARHQRLGARAKDGKVYVALVNTNPASRPTWRSTSPARRRRRSGQLLTPRRWMRTTPSQAAGDQAGAVQRQADGKLTIKVPPSR